MAEVMAVVFANFNNFMAVGATKFKAISLAVFLWAVIKIKVRYNLFKWLKKRVGADYEMNCLRIKGGNNKCQKEVINVMKNLNLI